VRHRPRVASILYLFLVTTQVIPHAFGRETKNKEASAGGDPPSNCVWTSAAMFPIPIMDEAVVTLGGNIYTFGGISEGKGVPNAYKFDGTTWTPIAPYPSACGVESPSAVTDGTFIYIMNGSTFCPLTYSTDVYRYDPSTDTYTQLSSNNVGTWNQTAVYLNGKIYKMGGKNATDYQTALEIYDIFTDTWSFGIPLPEPTGFASSWTQDGFIYIAGGVVASGVATNGIYAYDPVLQAWLSVAGLPDTRWGAAAAVYGDTIVMAGGLVGGVDFVNVSASAIYGEWVALPDMLEKRARMNGAVLGGSFYVIGGFSSEGDFLIGTTSNQELTCQFGPTPTPTATPSSTTTPTPSLTPTPTATPTPKVTPRPHPTPRPRPTPLPRP
jgi:N-acetylneuraminic acid mutarotase